MDLVEIRKRAKSKKKSTRASGKKTVEVKTGAKKGAAAAGKSAPKKKTRSKSVPPEPAAKTRTVVEEPESVVEETAVAHPVVEQSDVPAVKPVEEAVPDPGDSGRTLPEIMDVGSLDEILMSQRRGPEQEEVEECLQLLTLMVGAEEYGLNIMDIKEIIRPQEVTEVPRTPDYVLGIISLRGVIVPVFDIRLRLGLERGDRDRKARVVVVNLDDNLYGLLVDSVVQVLNIPVSRIDPPPEIIGGIDADFMKGVGKVEDRLVILIDLEKVLSTEEKEAGSSDD